MSSQSVGRQLVFTCALVCMFVLSGCGGTKVLKEAQPIQTTQPLATVSDQQVTAILDWVIVRDGPGTWAKNADWDEYLLRIRNLSDQPIQVIRVIVVDSLDTRIESQPKRKQLVKGSKQTARRYKDSGIKVKAGRGAGTMLVAGAAVTVIGVGAASVVAVSGATVAGSAGAAAGGLLLLGPALVVGGIVRGVRNSAVNKQIEQRQTVLPLELSAGEELPLNVFFPLAPSPGMVEISYTDVTGEHSLTIDTSTSLNGLHIGDPKE
ncbi:MAG: hypothetical protein IH930_11295 [Proteobacteria bacterium]|nr:hypothetical protein [Pseudomonadota bacterium]